VTKTVFVCPDKQEFSTKVEAIRHRYYAIVKAEYQLHPIEQEKYNYPIDFDVILNWVHHNKKLLDDITTLNRVISTGEHFDKITRNTIHPPSLP
jgi:hypothetical protein